MVRIAPVRLSFNPKTLWFDARDLELSVDDPVVVLTARGLEFGHMSQPVFEMSYEDTKKLKSPLKPVKRIATDEDVEKSDELARKGVEALPIFKQMAAENVAEMNPVAVEYLFDGDKAVFYFESEDRVDFRDLVRKLAAEFHVRVDMKQIGVRDEARMIGGLGHCGQELCCRRLGGEFNPVSIRMAKEQDLSLNPQKISGTCGRLMCCLRYEYDAYKDFHSRAPKKNAKIATPVGEGKVVDLDVPREIVSIQVGTDKPVKIPLAEMDEAEEGARPNSVGAEAWDRATTIVPIASIDASSLFTTELSGEDKLADRSKVRHVHEGEEKQQTKSRSRRRSSGRSAANGSAAEPATQTEAAGATTRKPRRRRSTTVKSDGTSKVVTAKAEETPAAEQAEGAKRRQRKVATDAQQASKSQSARRRHRSSSAKKTQDASEANKAEGASKPSQVGRKSSALRARKAQADSAQNAQKPAQQRSDQAGSASQEAPKPQARRRRRRSHKAGSEGGAQSAQTE